MKSEFARMIEGTFARRASLLALILPSAIMLTGISTQAYAGSWGSPAPSPNPNVGTTSVSKASSTINTSVKSSSQSGAISGSSSESGSESGSASGPATTESGEASSDATTSSGALQSSTSSAPATTAAGNITLRAGDNSFLYLPNPATHPNVSLQPGAYIFQHHVYFVCPTESAEYHITAYVLGGGSSHTSDKMPRDCAKFMTAAERIEATHNLLDLFKYMDAQLVAPYAKSTADKMLDIIGAKPVDVSGIDRSPQGEGRTFQSRTNATGENSVRIQRRTRVKGSN